MGNKAFGPMNNNSFNSAGGDLGGFQAGGYRSHPIMSMPRGPQFPGGGIQPSSPQTPQQPAPTGASNQQIGNRNRQFNGKR